MSEEQNKKPPRRRRAQKVVDKTLPQKPNRKPKKNSQRRVRRRRIKKETVLDERLLLVIEDFKKEFLITEVKETVKKEGKAFIRFDELERGKWSMTFSRNLMNGNSFEKLKIVKEYGFFKDKDA